MPRLTIADRTLRTHEAQLRVKRILLGFVAILCLLGIATLVHYRGAVVRNIDGFFYGAWLVVTMIAGMFTQVLATNYRAGKPLLDVTSTRLLFPLVFSLIVYYPIWALSGSAPNFFAFYGAFLNGYFWEQVVSSARVPNGKSLRNRRS